MTVILIVVARRARLGADRHVPRGDPILPESDFLKFGETYAVYTRPEDRSGFGGNVRGAAGRVTVAVWPADYGSVPDNGNAARFNVVVVTAKPSLWKEFIDAFDH